MCYLKFLLDLVSEFGEELTLLRVAFLDLLLACLDLLEDCCVGINGALQIPLNEWVGLLDSFDVMIPMHSMDDTFRADAVA